jgi:hypothetical protein
MRALVACEFSGAVRDALRAKGVDAMSCDLLPSESPGPHHQGDVRDLLSEPWDLVIAHPPCTYLSNSGVRWLHSDPDRWAHLRDGAEFFGLMARFNSPRIAIENPIQHKYAIDIHGLGKPTQIVQPWMFGHPESKATGLWLFGLPALAPTNDVRGGMAHLPKNQQQKVHHMAPGPERGKLRSKTFDGIAQAMATQWVPLLGEKP